MILHSTEVIFTQYSCYSVKTSVNRLIMPKIPGLTQNSRSFPGIPCQWEPWHFIAYCTAL